MHLSIYKLSGELDINLMIKNNENYHVKDVAYHMIVFFLAKSQENRKTLDMLILGVFSYTK